MAKNNLVFHARTKHMGIKYHFIGDTETNKEIELKHCRIEDQLADIFTKALQRAKSKLLQDKIGIRELYTKEKY